MRYWRPLLQNFDDGMNLLALIQNPYVITFGAGTGCGIWVSVWFCNQLNRVRSPRYYRRRARRVARSGW